MLGFYSYTLTLLLAFSSKEFWCHGKALRMEEANALAGDLNEGVDTRDFGWNRMPRSKGEAVGQPDDDSDEFGDDTYIGYPISPIVTAGDKTNDAYKTPPTLLTMNGGKDYNTMKSGTEQKQSPDRKEDNISLGWNLREQLSVTDLRTAVSLFKAAITQAKSSVAPERKPKALTMKDGKYYIIYKKRTG